MSKNHHRSNAPQEAANQNNQMSEDLGDGSRSSDKPGRDGVTSVERAPEQDAQDETAIEAFAEEGAGVAAKE